VVAPGNEVGHKIGNPTNAESKTEPEPTMKPNTSTAQRQISKYSSLASIALKLF